MSSSFADERVGRTDTAVPDERSADFTKAGA